LFPVTSAAAQQRVDSIDQALADLRAEVAALPAQERDIRAADIQALIAEQAQARNILSDKLDDRRER
jgi:ATP-dependent exoDNAse (exonuclease V) beta subunit